MINRYWATGLTGGVAGALDRIDPTDTDGSATVLAAGDSAEVITNTATYTYIARESAGATESSPDVIIPDNNPGDFWWELIEMLPQNTAMIDQIIYENIGGF